MVDLHPTTRCFPRSLNQAFRNTVETAQWFESHQEVMTTRDVVYWSCVSLAVFAVAALSIWIMGK